MKDNKFTNILRMNKKSLYQLVGQSKESNMRILPIFRSNLVISAKNFIYNFNLWIRASAYCNNVPDVVCRKNAVDQIFPFSHHLCYVGRNPFHGLSVIVFSFLNYISLGV